MPVYGLYHGKHGSTFNKMLIGLFSTLEGAKDRATIIVEEEAASGFDGYTDGPGMLSADPNILYRGLRDNDQSIWVEEFTVGS